MLLNSKEKALWTLALDRQRRVSDLLKYEYSGKIIDKMEAAGLAMKTVSLHDYFEQNEQKENKRDQYLVQI
jgi:hypothetical protein